MEGLFGGIMMKCKLCGFEKEYKTLALPAGDRRYWRCPNCGKFPYAMKAEVEAIIEDFNKNKNGK